MMFDLILYNLLLFLLCCGGGVARENHCVVGKPGKNPMCVLRPPAGVLSGCAGNDRHVDIDPRSIFSVKV